MICHDGGILAVIASSFWAQQLLTNEGVNAGQGQGYGTGQQSAYGLAASAPASAPAGSDAASQIAGAPLAAAANASGSSSAYSGAAPVPQFAEGPSFGSSSSSSNGGLTYGASSGSNLNMYGAVAPQAIDSSMTSGAALAVAPQAYVQGFAQVSQIPLLCPSHSTLSKALTDNRTNHSICLTFACILPKATLVKPIQ